MKTKIYSILFALGLLVGISTIQVVEAWSSADENTTEVRIIDSGNNASNEKLCEGTSHEHIHYDNSINTASREYWGVVHSFAIVFDEDFMANVDTETNFLCTNGKDVYKDCSFNKETDLGRVVFSTPHAAPWGGVKVTYQTMDWIAGNPKGLLWEYGTSDPQNIDIKPWLSSGGQQVEAVSFQLENYNTAQKVTTTSWTKMEYFYINPSSDHSNDSNWHHVYTAQVEPYVDQVDSDGDYIYWYGINGTAVTTFPPCVVGCHSLSITPNTLNVADVFNDTDFTVQAIATDDTDITADSTFTYYANAYGSRRTDGDADGSLYYGWPSRNGGSGPLQTTDSTVEYRDSQPGDSIYVAVTDYAGQDWSSQCYTQVEFPYCADLEITEDPNDIHFNPDFEIVRDDNITIEVEASNGEAWPYEVMYSSTNSDATFDGNGTPYMTHDWTVEEYASEVSSTVTVGLGDEDNNGQREDVAGLCSDSFEQIVRPPNTPPEIDNTCISLNITVPASPTLTCEEMDAQIVQISWTSMLTTGMATGPWQVVSSNPLGEFRLAGAIDPIGIGSAITRISTVYYYGSEGDTITVTDVMYPNCTDTLTSEVCNEAPFCSDLTLGAPYITNADGNKTTIDTQNQADLATLYNSTTVCWDFNLGVSDASFAGTLIAEASTGSLRISSNETGTSSPVGNPTNLGVTGFANYTGTVCWENFEPGASMSFYMLGDENACSVEETLPLPNTQNACVDLQMSPDSFTLAPGDVAVGTIDVTIAVQGSDSSWNGMLFVSHTGSGHLLYSDGSPAGRNGFLRIPVSGTAYSVTVRYVGGAAGDTVTAAVRGEADCADNFGIVRELIPYVPPEGPGPGPGPGTPPEKNVCEDVSFSEDQIDIVGCIDRAIEICVESEDSEDIDVSYNLGDDEGTIEYNGDEYEGSLTIDNVDDCVEVTFQNICEDAQISVDTQGEGDQCSDELDIEVQELGTFEKFIYTFNFSSEKNSYSDEGVFFAHDEDRAFYTLQYDPSGTEDDITFTDEMWSAPLEGLKGDGTPSNGNVTLATRYEDLIRGTSGVFYYYSLLTNMGFGCNESSCQEENSQDIADYIDDNFNSNNFMSFVPYRKYSDGSPSTMIEACQYATTEEGARGELTSTEVCYDPEHSPDNNYHDVLIENAGTIEDTAVIRVRYVGVIDSGLDCHAADDCLTEEFENEAQVQVYDGDEGTLSSTARLVVLCSYLLTENAGDVYLEVELQGGSDISCIFVDETNATGETYANTDALVILEDTSGAPVDGVSANITLCDNTDGTNSLIGNLSSYVCEIINSVTDLWKRTTVETTTESQVSQAIRNVETIQTPEFGADPVTDWTTLANTLKNTNNPNSNILYFKGDKITPKTLTLGTLHVPCGAWTVIVEDADLIISGNITYNTTCTGGLEYYQNIPSVAFVVQGGDISIKSSAYQLNGVYYTNQKFTGEDRSAVNQPLEVNGSFYGNIQELLDAANYVGPPTLEGGGLVIRYDSRIMLNTPPGLSEYVDVSTEKGVN